MPLSNLLHAAAGTCRYCGQKAGIIARAHRDCQETFQAGWTEMVSITADAAVLSDRRRLVRLQPGREPGTDVAEPASERPNPVSAPGSRCRTRPVLPPCGRTSQGNETRGMKRGK